MYYVINAFEGIYEGEQDKFKVSIEYIDEDNPEEVYMIAQDLSREVICDDEDILKSLNEIAAKNEDATDPLETAIQEDINYDVYKITALSDDEVYENIDSLLNELDADFDSFIKKYCK